MSTSLQIGAPFKTVTLSELPIGVWAQTCNCSEIFFRVNKKEYFYVIDGGTSPQVRDFSNFNKYHVKLIPPQTTINISFTVEAEPAEPKPKPDDDFDQRLGGFK